VQLSIVRVTKAEKVVMIPLSNLDACRFDVFSYAREKVSAKSKQRKADLKMKLTINRQPVNLTCRIPDP
jgi:hypothetical protein